MNNQKHEVDIHTDTDVQDVQELEAYRELGCRLKDIGEKLFWFSCGVAAAIGWFSVEIFG